MTHLEIGKQAGRREHLERAKVALKELGASVDLTEVRTLLNQVSAVIKPVIGCLVPVRRDNQHTPRAAKANSHSFRI